MNKIHRQIGSVTLFVTTATLAACSGSGSGGTPATSSSASAAPTTATSSTPTPSPTPSPTPQPVTVSGQIINHDTNAALPGAVVYISHALVAGATPPATSPLDGGTATTNPAGNYQIPLPAQSAYPARFYIEVFNTSAMSVAHEILTVSASGAQTVPTIGLTTLSSDEAGWLALVNQDRTSYNAAPIVSDETTEEQARLWLSWIAQDNYEHTCMSTDVNCPSKTAFAASENADFSQAGENIDNGPTTYEGADQAFMAEAANCPQPASYSTCTFSETTGHFLNTITPYTEWFGAADTQNGTPFGGNGSTSYYDEEFSDASLDGAQIMLKTYRTVVPVPHRT